MTLRPALAALLVAAAAACAPAQAPLPKTCAINGIDRVGGPISLVNGAGQAVTEAAFAGKATLLYFGFANCPDICPTSLQAAAAALALRPADAAPLNVALVTLDPARDTPQQMALYVDNDAFPPGLVGLTGTDAQVDAAKAAFKVFSQRREDPESAGQYAVDHSSLFYLMDASWKAAAIFPSELPPADIAACIDHALAKRS